MTDLAVPANLPPRYPFSTRYKSRLTTLLRLPGRIEIRIFLILYILTLPFQLLTTGAVLEQGTKPLVVLTAIHAGLVAALFWSLLANALVATQVVEDGTVSSLVVSYPFFFLGGGFRCGRMDGLTVIFVILIWLAVLLFHGRVLRGDAVHIAGRRVTFHQYIWAVRPAVGAA
jgi:hypothetical protein